MAEMSKEEMRDRLGNLNQIRDLLFGEQLQEYDRRFAELESNVNALQQQMQQQIEQLHESLTAELRSTKDALEKKLKYISAAADEEIDGLREQLENSNQKFNHHITSIDRNMRTQTGAVREELTNTKSHLESEIQQLQQNFLNELQQHYQDLADAKLSREDMSEILFDLCMRLKSDETQENQAGSNNQELYLPQPETSYQAENHPEA